MYLVTAIVVILGFSLLLIALVAWQAVRWLAEIVLSPVLPAARRAREARTARREKERQELQERIQGRLQESRERSRIDPEWKQPPTV